jgi:hypothetical protein
LIAVDGAGYADDMDESSVGSRDNGPVDPDGDPEMKQSAGQPDQSEGADDPAETDSD